MIAVRWVLTGALSLLWLVIAVSNASITWREWVRKEERVPSIVPVVGGFVEWLAATVCPSSRGTYLKYLPIARVASQPGVLSPA